MFLASMSHELRTPLNAIIGFTGTLLMELPGPLNPEQTRQLRTVQTSGHHLLSIINDLLDLAKIESGAVELSLEDVDCVDVTRTVVSSLQPLADAKELPLILRLPETGLVARSDSRALGQILINLVNNAIAFTEAGEVCVEVAHRPGCPSAHQSCATPAPASVPRTWTASSTPSSAAATVVTVPMAPVSVCTSAASCRTHRRGALRGVHRRRRHDVHRGTARERAMTGSMPIRVFLLDDHEIVRRGIADLLTGEPDLEIVGEAGTAAEAVRRIPAAAPDVAILDARLPDGSGIDVCRTIRADHPAVHCLILTSYDDDDAVLAAVLAGASGYVLKQIRGSGLIDAVRSVAAGHSLLDPRVTDRVLERLRGRTPSILGWRACPIRNAAF